MELGGNICGSPYSSKYLNILKLVNEEHHVKDEFPNGLFKLIAILLSKTTVSRRLRNTMISPWKWYAMEKYKQSTIYVHIMKK